MDIRELKEIVDDAIKKGYTGKVYFDENNINSIKYPVVGSYFDRSGNLILEE